MNALKPLADLMAQLNQIEDEYETARQTDDFERIIELDEQVRQINLQLDVIEAQMDLEESLEEL
jgi:hypothetical protein